MIAKTPPVPARTTAAVAAWAAPSINDAPASTRFRGRRSATTPPKSTTAACVPAGPRTRGRGGSRCRPSARRRRVRCRPPCRRQWRWWWPRRAAGSRAPGARRAVSPRARHGAQTSHRRVALIRAVRRPRLVGRRHLRRHRPGREDRLRGGAGVHAKPAHVAADGAHARGDSALPRAARGGRDRAVVCHALYLANLALPTPCIHEKSVTAMRATLETADAIGADAVVFHPGSHLGAGLDVALEQAVPALRETPRADERPLVAAPRELRRFGRHDRPLARRARATRRGTRPSSRLGCVCRLVPLVGVGASRSSPSPSALDAAVAELDRTMGCERLRCLHVNEVRPTAGRSTSTVTPRSAAARWEAVSEPSSRIRVSRSCRQSSRPAHPAGAGPMPRRCVGCATCTAAESQRASTRPANLRFSPAKPLPILGACAGRPSRCYSCSPRSAHLPLPRPHAIPRTLRVADVKLSFAVPRSWKSVDARVVATAAGQGAARENPQLAQILDTIAKPGSPVRLLVLDPVDDRRLLHQRQRRRDACPAGVTFDQYLGATKSELHRFGGSSALRRPVPRRSRPAGPCARTSVPRSWSKARAWSQTSISSRSCARVAASC